MKVKVSKKEESFKPVTIKITFESREELYNLYHRINIATHLIIEGSKGTDYPKPKLNNKDECMELWYAIRDVLNN